MVSQRPRPFLRIGLIAALCCFSARPLCAQEKNDSPKDLGYYRHFLHQAEMALEQKDGGESARKALDLCPKEVRHFEWHYLRNKIAPGLMVFKGHTSFVRGVAFSSDKKTMASMSADKTIKLWDLATGKLQSTLNDGQALRCVAFHPHKKILACGGWRETVTIWDWHKGEKLPAVVQHEHCVTSVAFSPDGSWLASASRDGTVQIAAFPSLEVKTSLAVSDVARIAFSPDGKYLAVGKEDGISLFTVPDLRLAPGRLEQKDVVTDLVFHPDGERLYSSGRQGVRIWEVSTGKLLNTINEGWRPVKAIALNRDGTTLATLALTGKLQIWREPFTKPTRTIPLAGDGFVAFHPNGHSLAHEGPEFTIEMIHLGEENAVVKAPEPIWSVQPVKDQFLVTMRKGSALFSLTEDGFKPRQEIDGHRGSVRAVAFQPSGRVFASAGADRVIKVRDLRDNKELVNLTGHKQLIRALSFSPDGKRLASASDDQTIKIWDPLMEMELRTLRGHKGMVTSVVFLPKADLLASSGGDGTIKLWNVKTGQNLQTWPAHEDGVSHLILSPDGKRLASAGADNKIKVWDAASGKTLHTLPSPTSMVQSLAFSPDGKRLASGGLGDGVTLWDPERGERVYTFSRVTGPINAVAFSPDGTTLFSGSYDGTIMLWKAPRRD